MPTPTDPSATGSSSADLTGHVEPGGDTWLLDLGAARIRKRSVSEMDNNVYLVTCAATGATLLVDAADDAARVTALLDEEEGDLVGILTTHRHWDHHRALPEVARATGARTLAGTDDADELPVAPDVRLGQGDTVAVGDLTAQIIALRGHTPGSVAVLLELPDTAPVLISGDSLFPGGPGKTGSPEDFTQLMDDLESRVFDRLPDSTVVLPGHGDNTVLGRERPQLSEWRARGW